MKNKLVTTLWCLFTVLLVITGSIAWPIYFRPFYYWQIDPLNIPEATGYDKQTVIAAYDEVLDYLVLPNRPFGTGVFPHSEDGASHFADCKFLFDLNTTVLAASAVGLVLLAVLRRFKGFTLSYPFGRHPAAVCGGGLLALFAAIGDLSALNSNRAFKVFHAVFFPGKDNWLFNRNTDPIIKALPQDFFMHCGVWILCSVMLCSSLLLVYGSLHRKQP